MTSKKSLSEMSKEQKAQIKKILMLNATLMMLLCAVGIMFMGKVVEFLGDEFTAYVLVGSLFFVSLSEIIIAKVLFGEADRR